jgi:hypothetical protein
MNERVLRQAGRKRATGLHIVYLDIELLYVHNDTLVPIIGITKQEFGIFGLIAFSAGFYGEAALQ